MTPAMTPAMTNDGGGEQTSLFSSDIPSNVIPFHPILRPADNSTIKLEVMRDLPPGPTARRLAAAKQSIRKHPNRSTCDTQGSLELEFLPPAPQAPRTLKTTVEARNYCDAPVAAPMHRSVAAFLDTAMILIGCGILVGIFQVFGGSIFFDKFDRLMCLSAVMLIALFYGFLFAVAGRETAGQNWTELQLINFDGFPPDRTSRFLRFTGCWLSVCACGIGLFWALLDEENLTWHDHMSKTFPTLRDGNTSLFRERPR